MAMPRLSFMKIIVGDVDRVFDFYNRVLGVEQHIRVRTGEGYEELDEIVSKPVGGEGGISLAIKRFVNRPAPVPGELQVGFTVENVDATLAAALEMGGSVLKPAVDMPEHGVRVAFFKDLEGHTVEIVGAL